MDDERLDEIERELREAERMLEQLEDGTYWSEMGEGADADATVELDPDVTAELQHRSTR